MDFVVVGLGLGTLAILSGVLLLGWLAGRWEQAAARASRPDAAAHDYAMAAWRRDSGQALLGAGSAVLLATVGALAGSLTDRTGAFLVTTTATVAALGLLFWAYLYRARHPIPPLRALPAERAPRQMGPALPPPVAAAPLNAAPPSELDASSVDAALPPPDLPELPAPAPDLSAALDEEGEQGAADPSPLPDAPEDPTEPAALAADGDVPTLEEQPAEQAPGDAPKIVELAAFAARAGRARASSGGDDET